MAIDKIMIGGIGTPEIKEIIDNLDKIFKDIKVNKHPLSDMENFAYKLYVEVDTDTKTVKNLVIEIEK